MKRAFFTLISLLLITSPSEGAGLGKLTLVKDLKVLSSPEEIRVLVNTGGDVPVLPHITSPEKKLLQMDIEKSYTDPSKRSFVIDDSYLEKVDIYQLNSETVRIRLYLTSPYREGASSVLRKGDGFVIPLKRGRLHDR